MDHISKHVHNVRVTLLSFIVKSVTLRDNTLNRHPVRETNNKYPCTSSLKSPSGGRSYNDLLDGPPRTCLFHTGTVESVLGTEHDLRETGIAFSEGVGRFFDVVPPRTRGTDGRISEDQSENGT